MYLGPASYPLANQTGLLDAEREECMRMGEHVIISRVRGVDTRVEEVAMDDTPLFASSKTCFPYTW